MSGLYMHVLLSVDLRWLVGKITSGHGKEIDEAMGL